MATPINITNSTRRSFLTILQHVQFGSTESKDASYFHNKTAMGRPINGNLMGIGVIKKDVAALRPGRDCESSN